MGLGVLFLGFTLLGALKSQAPDSIPSMTEIPLLNKFPLQPDFQEQEFQGEWFAIGLAQNTFRNAYLSQPAMHLTTFELKDDHSYNATYTWVRHQECNHRSYRMVPSAQPGQFIPANVPRSENFTIRVLATDYKKSAILLYVYLLKDRVYFENILYGKTIELSHEVKRQYIEVSKSLGFSDEHITITAPMADEDLATGAWELFDCLNSYDEHTRRSSLQHSDLKPSARKAPR